MLHKYLGDKNTAHHIYQHGLPRLLATSRRRSAPPRANPSRWRSTWAASRSPSAAAEQRDLDQVVAENEVQAALADAAHWLVTLVSAISCRQDDVRMPVLRMQAACPENLSIAKRQERQSHKASIRRFAHDVSHTKMLTRDRNNNKRTFDNMNGADQQLLEDFETRKLHKRRKVIGGDRLPPFRSQMVSEIPAADDAKYH